MLHTYASKHQADPTAVYSHAHARVYGLDCKATGSADQTGRMPVRSCRAMHALVSAHTSMHTGACGAANGVAGGRKVSLGDGRVAAGSLVTITNKL